MGLPIGAFQDWHGYLTAHGAAQQQSAYMQQVAHQQHLIGLASLSRLGARARRDKCASCGSREFRDHHGQTVCAYCRSVA